MGRKANTDIAPEDRRPVDRKLTIEGALTIVLLQPRIPQNTGSIARMCAATGSRLDIVNPLFNIDDKKLIRAGLDYWHLLDVRIFENFEQWQSQNPKVKPWLVEVKAPKLYTEVQYAKNDFIFMGDEQDGIAPDILEKWPDRFIRIPQQGVRSLNLAMATGIVSYEALRQIEWLSLD